MSVDDLELFTEEALEPSHSKRMRAVIGDAFTFIQSVEVNQGIAAVSLEDLMGDQIKRNGESASSNGNQYDPYGYSPEKEAAAGGQPEERANFLGGSDTSRPTKLDRITAIVNNISSVVDEIKRLSPQEVADNEEYMDVSDIAAPEDF